MQLTRKYSQEKNDIKDYAGKDDQSADQIYTAASFFVIMHRCAVFLFALGCHGHRPLPSSLDIKIIDALFVTLLFIIMTIF